MGQKGGHGEGLEGESLGDLSPTYAFPSVSSGLTMAPSAFPQGKQIDKGVAWGWGKRIYEYIPPNTKYIHPGWLLQPGAEGPHFLQ